MRKKGLLSKKILHIVAAAALSVSLLGSQMQPVLAKDPIKTVKIEENRMVFDTFFIEEGMPLSVIELPEYAEGTLQWEKKEYIPDECEVECVIIFTPNKDQDLKKYKSLDGWDSIEEVLKVKVKIIVESSNEENFDDLSVPAEKEVEETSKISDESVNETVEESAEDSEIEENSKEIVEEVVDDIAEEIQEEIIVEETIVENESDSVVINEKIKENKEEAKDNTLSEAITENIETADDIVTKDISGETAVDDVPEVSEEVTENTDIFEKEFDHSESEVHNAIINEDLSDEEKQKIAVENHSSNGIVVSGENLPWYVQFRAYQAEESMFFINSDANVFQCFEFELWDLLNDTEYNIPDGEYVSVSIPVLEGYEYTVEHILESGAIEMITPTVDGSQLIFSTNTFSPFGIAGSTPIVGGDVIDDGYQIPTVQPTATPTPTQQPMTTPKSTTPMITEKPTIEESVGGQTASDTNIVNTNSNNINNGNAITSPVQTGDATVILPFVILASAAGIAILLVIVLKKRKK